MSDGELAPALVEALNCYKYGYMPFRKLAQSSRVMYEIDVTQFLLFLQELGLVELGKCQRRHVKAFLRHLERKGLENVTIRRKLIIIQTFFAWLKTEGVVVGDPAGSIALPPREEYEPRVLTRAEIERLLAVVNKPRDKAIIQVFLQTGISLSELQRLSVADVQLPQPTFPNGMGLLRIIGKGCRKRTLLLNSKASHFLAVWLRVRPPAETQALFVSNRRRRLSSRQIQRMISNYFRRTEIMKGNTQVLRVTFATYHLVQGANLATVSEYLGFASGDSAEIYIQLAKTIQEHPMEKYGI